MTPGQKRAASGRVYWRQEPGSRQYTAQHAGMQMTVHWPSGRYTAKWSVSRLESDGVAVVVSSGVSRDEEQAKRDVKRAAEAAKAKCVTPEPPPVPNEKPAVWGLVLADMQARDAEGRRKYGTPLQPHNGRDALVDAYQEALDLAVYLRQAIYERDGR